MPKYGFSDVGLRLFGAYSLFVFSEMDGWQADARLRVAQLLCWLILCAEEGSTQHANTIVRTLHRGASDDDPRITLEVGSLIRRKGCLLPFIRHTSAVINNKLYIYHRISSALFQGHNIYT